MAKLDASKRNALPKKDFAEPGKRKFPVENKAHAADAKARASQAVKSGRMSESEKAKIDRKANEKLYGSPKGPKGRK